MWVMWETVLFHCKYSATPEATHWRESLTMYMERPSFLKNYTVLASGTLSTFMELGNDFMANMEAQPQATNTRKKLNNSKEYEAVFHSGKSHQSWGEGKIVSSHTDILVQNGRVLTSEGFC